MRFDDRLKTVLAQPSADSHDCAVRWRQLVDLVARAGRRAEGPLLDEALGALKSDWDRVDEARRAAAARAVAGYALPVDLIALFAADSATVGAPVLSAARLSADEWHRVLAGASSETRRFVDSLHPNLGLAATPTDARPEPSPAEAFQPPTERTPSQGPVRPLVPSISDLVARIERLRHSRPDPEPGRRPQPATPQHSAGGVPALFRWECGPSGEIAWVEGAPRGALVGRTIARSEDDEGVDEHVERAFAVRAPFRDATLTLAGEGVVAGEWRISGIPAFEPNDGRFAGYRGVAMRDLPAERAPAAAVGASETAPQLDPDTLRELVHEVKTPLNAIIGFAEIIEGQYLGPADRRYRDRADEIVGQARLLLAAIDDLDLAAKSRAGRDSGAAPTDIRDLFDLIVPDVRGVAEARGTTLDLAFDPDSKCHVEPVLAARLLRRFLTTMVSIADRDDRLRLTYDGRGARCRLWISRPGKIRRTGEKGLFEMQFGGTSSELPFGIALRLVRGLARIAGGELLVERERLGLALPARQ